MDVTLWQTVIAAIVTIAVAWIKRDTNQRLSQIHTLVNSNMGAQLKISAVALRELAEVRKTPRNIAAADLAEKLLKEHEEKQAAADKAEA